MTDLVDHIFPFVETDVLTESGECLFLPSVSVCVPVSVSRPLSLPPPLPASLYRPPHRSLRPSVPTPATSYLFRYAEGHGRRGGRQQFQRHELLAHAHVSG